MQESDNPDGFGQREGGKAPSRRGKEEEGRVGSVGGDGKDAPLGVGEGSRPFLREGKKKEALTSPRPPLHGSLPKEQKAVAEEEGGGRQFGKGLPKKEGVPLKGEEGGRGDSQEPTVREERTKEALAREGEGTEEARAKGAKGKPIEDIPLRVQQKGAVKKREGISGDKRKGAGKGRKGKGGEGAEGERHEKMGERGMGVKIGGEKAKGEFLDGLKAQGLVKVGGRGEGQPNEAEGKGDGEGGKEPKFLGSAHSFTPLPSSFPRFSSVSAR